MNPPINVFDYEALAQVALPLVNWDFFYGGSDDEVTLRANRSAFERIRLRPRVLMDVNRCDISTSVLGLPVSMPVLLAPSAAHGLAHPDAELATARAAGAARTLSTESTRSLEEVRAVAQGPLWYQLY